MKSVSKLKNFIYSFRMEQGQYSQMRRQKSTKKCKRLKKRKKCKKKKVWKKCLKTCEKCDDSGTQINIRTCSIYQHSLSPILSLRINEHQKYLFSLKLLLCLMPCEVSNESQQHFPANLIFAKILD